MNCLNRSSVDTDDNVRAELGTEKIKPEAKSVNIPKTSVAPRLVFTRAKIQKSDLEKLKLPRWIDLLQSFFIHF